METEHVLLTVAACTLG